ncbi:hypothetical protein FDJ70_07560 [Clostridium botulinum]|uniref:hypothetical protein n=1 Tax=Clostridium TaxID=1485 RepID=UPI0004D57135|nr:MULTISPECIES: hypothetical protein [Clostridium]KEI08001.1 hypothetical protein Z958_p0076 [Clostridium novyi B str. NCTC 9691]KEI12796.1 hypothetical protein Z958_05890 [Clostridium novyi B str. NCTC 9691]MCD3217490.1 hypothetical protein [Clostridium botulinum C]NFV47529.1 hypothetical protein [Clostridium botulinum]
MKYNEPQLFFCENNKKGNNVGGVITKYKPPAPKLEVKSNKVLLGYTHFQEEIKSDTVIKFSIAFDISSEVDKLKYLKFIRSYNQYFYFVDEFGVKFKGKFVNTFDTDMPIEGEIYYISLEMLCPHSVEGFKGE